MYRVSKEASFSAAHHLRNYNGKCENVHGHNYKVIIVAQGKTLPKNGLLVDFGELKENLNEILSILDHADLNKIPPFDKIEPSAENLACYIAEEMGKRLDSESILISEATVYETAQSWATFIRE